MTKANFIKYLKKNKIKTPQKLTTLEESIFFHDSTGRVDIFYDKTSSTIALEPHYKHIKYSEIDIELINVTKFSFSSNGNKIKFKDALSYGSLEYLEMSKTELFLQFITDSNDIIQLSLSYGDFYIDYDPSDCLSFSLIDYVNKLEKSNRLFTELCETVDNNTLKSISEADYGYGAKKCFKMLKQIQQTQSLPQKPDFELEEVLSLTCFGSPSNHRDKIEILFSSVCLLNADYGNDSPIEHRLIKLLIESTALDNKKSLLAYYVKYLQTKHQHENPNLLLALLISTTMCFLNYPSEDINLLLGEVEKKSYQGCYKYTFVPDGTFEDFNSILISLPNEYNSLKISNMLKYMFKDKSD